MRKWMAMPAYNYRYVKHAQYLGADIRQNIRSIIVFMFTKNVNYAKVDKMCIRDRICSKCHPFYTGQQKAAQARGRIDKFNKKYGLNK